MLYAKQCAFYVALVARTPHIFSSPLSTALDAQPTGKMNTAHIKKTPYKLNMCVCGMPMHRTA